jgi:hypothetical protein
MASIFQTSEVYAMKTKIIVFLLALALLMLVAIPATAGPIVAAPALELPAFWTVPTATASVEIQPIRFEVDPPFMAATIASPPIALKSSNTEIYIHAVMATLAAVVGLWLASKAYRLMKYDPRDRMHGLARDQDATA